MREEYADHSEGRPSADRFQGREKQAQEQSEGWRDYLDFGSRLEGGGVYRCRAKFKCEKPLKLDAVSFEIKGVGEVNVSDLTCNELKVALRGVGSADIHVACDYLSAQMGGVGECHFERKRRTRRYFQRRHRRRKYR